jgi:hypothetical protein
MFDLVREARSVFSLNRASMKTECRRTQMPYQRAAQIRQQAGATNCDVDPSAPLESVSPPIYHS